MDNIKISELENKIAFSLYSIELEKVKIQNYKKQLNGEGKTPMYVLKQFAYQRAMEDKDEAIPMSEQMYELNKILSCHE